MAVVGYANPGTGWRKLRLDPGPHAAALDVLVHDAQGAPSDVTPVRPALAREPGSGRAKLSLTLLLERAPTVTDTTIVGLIAGGRLALTATLGLPGDADARLHAAGVTRWRPAFARSATFTLSGVGAAAACEAAGSAPSGALSAALARDAAVAVLGALDGDQSDLRLCARQVVAGCAVPVEHDIALHELLPRALAGTPRDAYVSLVTLDGRPAPRRVSGLPRTRDVTPGRVSLAARPGRLESVALALTPDRRRPPAAAALAASTLVAPLRHDALASVLAASDIIVPLDPGDDLPDLPLVDDPAATSFPGHAGGRWYAPVPRAVIPAPNDDPASSAFCFTFEQSGVVAGLDGPRPGLTATVRATIDLLAPEGAGDAKPVSIGEPSVTLDVPFRAAGSAEVRRQLFAGTVDQRDGRLVATFELLDDWVRLAYGALAIAGFQAESPRLRLTYAFRAYVPAPEAVSVDVGGKVQLVAPIAAGVAGRRRPVFDPSRAEVHAAGETLRFATEPGSRALRAPTLVAARPVATPRGVTAATAVMRPQQIAVHAPLLAAVQPASEKRRVIRTLVREEQVEVLYPCGELGGLYRQRTGETEEAVGCQDALRLGEIHYALYEDLPDLAGVWGRVLRSLRQPGHFLVVPASYRVTRYEATEPPDRAYRPAILLYAALADDPAHTRVHLSATLEPDLAPWMRAKLIAKLGPLCPAGKAPVLELPTDAAVAARTACTWALPDAFEAPDVQVIDRMLQVSLSTTLQDATLLRALLEGDGAHGAITFTLPDDMAPQSAVVLDTNPTGPWNGGVVSARRVEGGVELVNHVERAVNVLDLLGDGAATVAVNRTLAPGERATVPTDGLAGDPLAVTAPATGAMTLAELDVFVEEIATNVIFVNLVSYANHGLSKLVVTARLQGTQQCWAAELVEQASATVEMQLGLMTYLEHQVLEYQVAKQSGDAVTTTPWLTWDLERQGNVVSITWESIAGSANPQ